MNRNVTMVKLIIALAAILLLFVLVCERKTEEAGLVTGNFVIGADTVRVEEGRVVE